MKKPKGKRIPLFRVVLYIAGFIVAYGLKRLYSVSGSEDLLWILYPTAILVESLSGLDFIFVPDAGFVNHVHDITIAPACSGVNLMIICFCASFFSFLHLKKSAVAGTVWLGISITGAYLFTILVNTLRIVISIILIKNEIHYGFFDQARMHLIAGVMINCFFLFLFHQLMGRVADSSESIRINGADSTIILKTLVAASPLCWYFFVMLAIPVITGRFKDDSLKFSEFGAIVMVTCFIVFLIFRAVPKYIKPGFSSLSSFFKLNS